MIKFNNKQVSIIKYGAKTVSYVYRGLNLVYQSVMSCFGSGFWRGAKPWKDNEKWKS